MLSKPARTKGFHSYSITKKAGSCYSNYYVESVYADDTPSEAICSLLTPLQDCCCSEAIPKFKNFLEKSQQENSKLKAEIKNLQTYLTPYHDEFHYMRNFPRSPQKNSTSSGYDRDEEEVILPKFVENTLQDYQRGALKRSDSKSNFLLGAIMAKEEHESKSYDKMFEMAQEDYKIANYLFQKRSCRVDTLQDVTRSLLKFKNFSPKMLPVDLKPFLKSLVKEGKNRKSTLNKIGKHCKKFFKTFSNLSEEERFSLKFMMRGVLSQRSTYLNRFNTLKDAVSILLMNALYEEGLFLHLNFSLGLSPKILHFLTIEGLDEESAILQYWNPSTGEFQKVKLNEESLALISNYWSWRCQSNENQQISEREGGANLTTISGSFIFNKTNSYFYKQYKSRFRGLCPIFNLTPSEVLALRDEFHAKSPGSFHSCESLGLSQEIIHFGN